MFWSLNFEKCFFGPLILDKGEGAKLASINFKKSNSGTPKLNGAKLYIVNQNGTNLTSLLSRGIQTLV